MPSIIIIIYYDYCFFFCIIGLFVQDPDPDKEIYSMVQISEIGQQCNTRTARFGAECFTNFFFVFCFFGCI